MASVAPAQGISGIGRWFADDRSRAFLALAPAVLFFAVVYGGSLVRLAFLSVDAPVWSLRHFDELALDTNLWRTLGSTLRLSLVVTLICCVLGYPVALVMLRSSPRVQRLLTLLLILPLWTSTLVRSYAWMVLLGRRGVVNETLISLGVISSPLSLLYNEIAVYIGMVHVLLPYMIFPLFAVMKQIDLRLINVARSLGAGKTTAMLSVFLPLSLPGLAAGCVLVFVMALGFWVTPALLGGTKESTYVMLIETQVSMLANWPLASAMSLTLLAVTLLILLLAQKLLGFSLTQGGSEARAHALVRLVYFTLQAVLRVQRPLAALAAKVFGARTARVPDDDAGPAGAWAENLVSKTATVLVMVFLFAPILILFPLSFSAAQFMQFPPQAYSLQWYVRYFTGADWTAPTLVSFQVAIPTMLIATIVGTAAGLAMVTSQFRFKNVLGTLLLSPLIVPTIIIGVALYFQFAPLKLVGTIQGMVIAHLVLAIPFVIVVIMSTLQNFDFGLTRAARSLGAGPFTTFRRVTLPLIWPGILAAMFFAFLASFDEVVMAIFLSGTNAATLPKRLLDATRFEFRPTVAAVSVLLIVLSFVIVLLADFAQSRLGRHKTKQKQAAEQLASR